MRFANAIRPVNPIRFAGRLFAVGLVALALGPLSAAAGSHGKHGSHGEISIEGAFARASAGPARNGAAYFTIKNSGMQADRLLAAKAAVSARVELHTHIHDAGVMKMRPVEAIEVPAGGHTQLKPGGDHVMFMGLKAPLKEGEAFPLTLVFEKAGEVTVSVKVGPVGAMGAGHGGHGKHKMK